MAKVTSKLQVTDQELPSSGDTGGSGQWTNCMLTGNTVECDWTSSSSGPSGSRSGTLTATLLTGDHITAQFKDREGFWVREIPLIRIW